MINLLNWIILNTFSYLGTPKHVVRSLLKPLQLENWSIFHIMTKNDGVIGKMQVYKRITSVIQTYDVNKLRQKANFDARKPILATKFEQAQVIR